VRGDPAFATADDVVERMIAILQDAVHQ